MVSFTPLAPRTLVKPTGFLAALGSSSSSNRMLRSSGMAAKTVERETSTTRSL